MNQSDPKFLHTIDLDSINNNPSKNTSGILKIVVLDNGGGMSKNAVSNLFKQFNQHGSSESKRLGTGMGLWISKHLCENMLGDMKAFSKETKGSAFVSLVKTDIIEQQIVQPEIVLNNPIQRRNLKVMIVDDMKMNCDIHSEFMGKCGIDNIEIAIHGKEALEKFQARGENYFDIILMDVEMPVMDGNTAAKKIREFEERNNWRPVCLVMITGNSNQTECADYLDINKGMKANFVFPKPFTLLMCQRFIGSIA